MGKKILIIEDEKKLSKVMGMYLYKEGYEVTSAYDGEEGERFIDTEKFDLIILDIMMPKKDGWSLLRKVKRETKSKVILTTARGEEEDRIFGLELGADDYMVKPLSMRELVLRVNLRIKEIQLRDENHIIKYENISIDKEQREIIEGNIEVILTPKEFDLLLFLLDNPKQVFNRENLLDKVWGYDYFGDTRTVDTHIKKLREKIKFCREHIKTVWKVGYKLDIE